MLKKIGTAITGSKKPENMAAALKAVEQISAACVPLAEKAEGLKEKYPQIYTRIISAVAELKNLTPDVSVQAGKIEQSIAQKITCVSSSCDAILSGGDAKPLLSHLDDFEQLIKQRTAVK